MSLTALGDSGPVKAGVPAIDYATGMIAAFGVVSALFERERSGAGQHVDVSMLDTALVLMSSVVTDVKTRGSDPKPVGNTLGASYGTNRAYRALGELIWISAPEPHQQAALWSTLGRADLPARPEFLTEELRAKNVDALTAEIEATLGRRSATEWGRDAERGWRPCHAGPICFRSACHAAAGAAGRCSTRSPTFLAGAPRPLRCCRSSSHPPAQLQRRPPLLGEHTDQVLLSMARSPDEISALRAGGVI